MTDRRDFLKSAGAAALTTSLFTGKVRGANDKIAAAFIGMGKMGRANLHIAMGQENLVPVAVCDVFQRNLDWAVRDSKNQAKPYRDFREVLADKSIDVVCISTPDHWHAYMTVEACKAGKDVYVEKPICVVVDEGVKMVEAARKYKRVVQAGTMQRSALHFKKAVDIVRSGALGQITFVRTWNYGNEPQEGYGNPPDTEPPSTLDWDMWLGPAPKRHVQCQPLWRGSRRQVFFHLPLVLGLCGRNDDGLGRALAGYRADGGSRRGSGGNHGTRRKILAKG